jgi:hypothetical protein
MSAARHTTHDQAAAELQASAAAGHQVAPAAVVADVPPAVDENRAGVLFQELAHHLDALDALLLAVRDGSEDLWHAAFSLVSSAGWLADEASRAHGGMAVREDGAAWMLPPRAREALQAAALTTRTEGGAA